MAIQFLRIGKRFVNLTNIGYIQKLGDETNLIVQIFNMGNPDTPYLTFTGEEGKALLTWLENSATPVFPEAKILSD